MRECKSALLAIVLALCVGTASIGQTLDVGLYVLGTEGAVLYSGWPLLLNVSFANQQAYNDYLYNLDVETQLNDLAELVDAGTVTEAEAASLREALALREITPVVLGTESNPWTEFISFESSDGALPWAIELLAEDVSSVLVLDETGSADAWYGLDADASAEVSPGVYEVSVVVSTELVSSLPAGTWTGRASSQPVRIDVRAEPELTEVVLARKWVVFGQDALYRGTFEAAEAYLADAVALDPTSLDAWCLLGEAQAALGKLEEALDSFRRALELALLEPAYLYRDEPPDYLYDRIAWLQEELGVMPTPEEEP